jgi:hypothetical protein
MIPTEVKCLIDALNTLNVYGLSKKMKSPFAIKMKMCHIIAKVAEIDGNGRFGSKRHAEDA